MLQSVKIWWFREWKTFWRMAGGQGFVATVASVFLMGFLLGWAVFAHTIDPKPIGLGSVADWLAAAGAIAAAGSTIAIALLGQRAITNKNRIAHNLAVSTIRSAVFADMEMAVRVSRHWQVLKTEKLIHFADTLVLHEVPREDASVSGLPGELLSSFMAARSTLAQIKKAARDLEKSKTESRRKYLAFQFERFGLRLKPTANYVSRKETRPLPWKDWKPLIDTGEFNEHLMKRYHAMEARLQALDA